MNIVVDEYKQLYDKLRRALRESGFILGYVGNDVFVGHPKFLDLADLKTRVNVLESALVKCRRELWHCNKQLVSRGATEGASVTEALAEADKALKQEVQQ